MPRVSCLVGEFFTTEPPGKLAKSEEYSIWFDFAGLTTGSYQGFTWQLLGKRAILNTLGQTQCIYCSLWEESQSRTWAPLANHVLSHICIPTPEPLFLSLYLSLEQRSLGAGLGPPYGEQRATLKGTLAQAYSVVFHVTPSPPPSALTPGAINLLEASVPGLISSGMIPTSALTQLPWSRTRGDCSWSRLITCLYQSLKWLKAYLFHFWLVFTSYSDA